MTTTHPLHQRYLPSWRFYLAAWQGTEALVRHGALPRHPRETEENYRLRREHAISFNYSRAIVDIFLHHLFEQPGERAWGPLAEDQLCQAFLTNTDCYGADYDAFWYEAQQYAAVLGHVGILVTKAPAPVLTRADELAAGLHPYYALYLPQAILDWRHGRDELGRPRLEYVKLRDDDGTVRVWTTTHWECWTPAADGALARTASGDNPLGRVPFVWHFNARGSDRWIGVSDIQDVARIDVSIMRNISQADEVVDLAAFPMLLLPRSLPGAASEDVAVGPRAVLAFDPQQPEARPDWLRAEVLEPIDAILRFIALKVEEIYRMTNTRAALTLANQQMPSGRALEVLFRQLNARLTTKARQLEEAETSCLRLWLAWQQQEALAGRVVLRRPRQFAVQEVAEDLAAVLSARDVVRSPRFHQELQKSLARRLLPGMTADQQRQVDAEIERG